MRLSSAARSSDSGLFVAFARGGNVGRVEGTGLGMVVVKQATNQLGGELSVRSELGVGTTITVLIPTSSAAEAVQSRTE